MPDQEQWKRIFDQKIIDRGRLYYQQGKVLSVIHKGSQYIGKIQGTKQYRTIANYDEAGRLVSLSCGCAYAAGGQFCKHMAALLFAIDAGDDRELNFPKSGGQGDIWKKKISRRAVIAGLREEFSGAYYYLDFPSMVENAEIPVKVWEDGRKLADSGEVVLDSLTVRRQQDYISDTDRAEGFARAFWSRGRMKAQVPIIIRFGRDRLLQMECGNWSCSGDWYSGGRSSHICAHMAAALWLAGRYILENNPGDATDTGGKELLDTLRDRGVRALVTDSDLRREITGDIRRSPLAMDFWLRLNPGTEAPAAVFRIGEGRLYKIKDLWDFVNAMDRHAVMSFGSKTQLALGEERLDESSKPLYALVRDVVRQEQEAGRLLINSWESGGASEEMPLYGERLDRLFALSAGKSRELKITGGQARTLCFRDQTPVAELEADPLLDERGIFHGVRVAGLMPGVILGRDYGYWIGQDALNRFPLEKWEEMKPLWQLSQGGRVQFQIGRKNLSSFMYETLPWMREHARVTVEQEEIIRQYLAPKAGFVFYLDTEERVAVCRAEAVYGDVRIPLCPEADDEGAEGAKPVRDREREEIVRSMLRQYFPESDRDGTRFSTGADERYIYLLLEEGAARLLQAGEVQSTDAFRRLSVRREPRITVGVRLDAHLLNLRVESSDLSQEEMIEILGHYKSRKKYYRLRSGDFINLEEDSLTRLRSMMETLGLTPAEFVRGKTGIPAYRSLYLDNMLEQSRELMTDRDSRFKEVIRRFQSIENADAEVPPHLKGVLRSYQKAGFRWMMTLAQYGFGGILADEMGLGKTLQTIALLEAVRLQRHQAESTSDGAEQAPPAGPGDNARAEGSGAEDEPSRWIALVTAPASLIYNWCEELGRFAPDMQVALIAGSQTERNRQLEAIKDGRLAADVLVTSYDLLKRDIPAYEGMRFDFSVIDEAQYIKNHTTAASRAVKVIQAKCRLALTGTPIENRLSELWSIFDYLMPGFLYSYERFRRDLETPIVRENDRAAAERLSRMVTPFILRRYKRDVLKELPEKLEEVRYSRMQGSQKTLYDAQILHIRELLGRQKSAEDFNHSRMQILAELTRVRQICCDPSLCFENYRGESAKRAACMDLIRSAVDGEHRILVFSQFTSMLALLEKDLEREGMACYKITGQTPKQERVRLVSDFNTGDVPVFLISLKAGGTGLNLVGADVVIHYDPWWNLAVQNQATDRAHRMGQTRRVTVYKLMMKDTVEEKIMEMQESKKQLADDILQAEAIGRSMITREDLEALLE